MARSRRALRWAHDQCTEHKAPFGRKKVLISAGIIPVTVFLHHFNELCVLNDTVSHFLQTNFTQL
jgi:hypothetical protein